MLRDKLRGTLPLSAGLGAESRGGNPEQSAERQTAQRIIDIVTGLPGIDTGRPIEKPYQTPAVNEDEIYFLVQFWANNVDSPNREKPPLLARISWSLYPMQAPDTEEQDAPIELYDDARCLEIKTDLNSTFYDLRLAANGEEVIETNRDSSRLDLAFLEEKLATATPLQEPT